MEPPRAQKPLPTAVAIHIGSQTTSARLHTSSRNVRIRMPSLRRPPLHVRCAGARTTHQRWQPTSRQTQEAPFASKMPRTLPRLGCGLGVAATAAGGRRAAPRPLTSLLHLLLLAVASALLAAPTAALDTSYLGCYDGPTSFVYVSNLPAVMTPTVCRDLAAGAGYKLYGVQNGENGKAKRMETLVMWVATSVYATRMLFKFSACRCGCQCSQLHVACSMEQARLTPIHATRRGCVPGSVEPAWKLDDAAGF